jgi:hypothetical protein
MPDWMTVVEPLEGYYLVLRHTAGEPAAWYVAVLRYPGTFRPAPSSITAPPDGIDWGGPFPSRAAARAAATLAIAHGCVTPSADLEFALSAGAGGRAAA